MIPAMETAYIALGSNLPSIAGAPQATLEAAIQELGKLGHVTARSRFYTTEPVGYADQPAFLNAAIALETTLAPEPLLDRLLEIERLFGRDRSHGIANGPRTLDLDLILYGNRILATERLLVPHPRMHQRSFVLLPLAEIAPDTAHPVLHQSMKELLQALPEQHEQ
jgi:2-amino-4-hydroxy-6-hydroxymethyldihydropteridine diphosphokinase